MAPTTKHHVIPEGELNCLWMEAGLTDYKLCDKNYQCEQCSFDVEMRKSQLQTAEAGSPEHNANSKELFTMPMGNQTANEYFSRLCDEDARTIFERPLPNDRIYFRNHTWLKREPSPSITMGIDHVGAHLLQQMVSVVLPETPTHLEQNSPFVWIVFREGTIALRSGSEGMATQTNEELLDHPMLLTSDPYRSGWVLRMSISESDQKRACNEHAKSFAVLKAELTELKSNFMSGFRHEQLHAATQYDGGRPLKAIHEIIGEKKYFEIVNRFLSHNI